jgi:hypothetical protein
MSTESPTSLNAQDFSGSDDEILDNFADGPDGANQNDDGTPMGLGGEKGKQSEPASATLESDIVNEIPSKEEPGEAPENTATSEPVQDAGETVSEPIPEQEPETPEFPPQLLQMAGFTDASAAQSAGFQTPESLFSAVKLLGRQLTAQPAQSSAQGLYRRTESSPAEPAQEAPAEPTEVQPFQLPELEGVDEDLQDVLRQMNEHYQSVGASQASQQKELESLRAELKRRDESLALQQEQNEEIQFDEAVQSLGDWKDVFGEGSGRDLDRAGQFDPAAMTAFNHRKLLFDTVQAVREVNASQGRAPMTLEQEVQFALFQRYPDKFQQTISGNSDGKSSRAGVTASRPTQRNTPPKSQNERVLSDVNAMLKKKGYSLDMNPDADEFDGDI